MSQDEVLAITPDMIHDVIKTMNNNVGLYYSINSATNSLQLTRVTAEDLKALSERIDSVHVVCWSDRSNSALFVNTLEYKYFPPGTPENDLFEYRMFKWNDMLWFICTVPANKKDILYQVAKESNLKLVEGFPCVIDKDGPHQFPMHYGTIFSIENLAGSVIYEGQGGKQDEDAAESYKIKQLFKSFYKKHLIDWEPSTDEMLEFEQFMGGLPHKSVWDSHDGNTYIVDQTSRYLFLLKGDDDTEWHKKLIVLLNRMNWHLLDAREHKPIFKD